MKMRWLACTAILIAVSAVSASADEASAVAALKKLGAKIKTDDKLPGKPVVEVDLSGTKVTDAGLKHLAALKGLWRLDLSGTKVTDAGMKPLTALKGLKELFLANNPKVTDKGLKELTALTGLQRLELSGTKVTNAGFDNYRAAVPGCSVTK
jgi:hypothetical protein